jgi:hypothetical protein
MAMVTARGSNGSVTFDGKTIKIVRQLTLGTFLNQGCQGDRYIIARHITAVEFKDSSKRRGDAGFISFDFPGKNPPRGGVFDALADENAVVFDLDQRDEFRRLLNAVLTFLSIPAPEQGHGHARKGTPPDQEFEGPSRVASPWKSERTPSLQEPDGSGVPLWVKIQWHEGTSGWTNLVHTAKANGWNAKLGVGEMRFEQDGVEIVAFSASEAAMKLAKFYIDRQ